MDFDKVHNPIDRTGLYTPCCDSSICSFLAVLIEPELFSSSVCVCCFSCVPEFPTNLSELSSKVSELPSKLAAGVGEVTQKCVLQ